MASYPSAVKSFSAKTAGQTIDPGHVNDIQDEVTAVESALVTGPITLTDVTVANTFAAPRKASCKLATAADTAIDAANTPISPNWTVETFDTGLHSTSANSSRINLTSSGVW